MKRPIPALAAPAILAAFLGGCAHAGPLPASVSRGLRKVAVIARVDGAPVSTLARGDVRMARRLGGDAVRADARIEGAMDRSISRYELASLLRSAFTGALGRRPPWPMASPLDVDSALGSLLATEKEPDVAKLAPLGVDAAFDLEVVHWGVRKDGLVRPPGYWMVVRVRLLAVPSGRRLWSAEVSVDGSAAGAPRAARLDFEAMRATPEATLKAGLARVAAMIGKRVGGLVAGR